MALLYKYLTLLIVVGAVTYTNGEEKSIEIPITSELKSALLQANPDLFGTFDSPKRAACKCRLEPLDVTPFKTQRFKSPATNSKWRLFLTRNGGLDANQYDKADDTVSWGTLELFEKFLKNEHEPEIPVGELLKMVVSSTAKPPQERGTQSMNKVIEIPIGARQSVVTTKKPPCT